MDNSVVTHVGEERVSRGSSGRGQRSPSLGTSCMRAYSMNQILHFDQTGYVEKFLQDYADRYNLAKI